MPIIIPRLDDPESASADERDEHLMLLEDVRHDLDVEWAGTLAAFDEAGFEQLGRVGPERVLVVKRF